MTEGNAVHDFLKMVAESWTWDKLTYNERAAFCERIGDFEVQGRIKGTYKQRYDTMHMLYDIFLAALGYHGGIGWDR